MDGGKKGVAADFEAEAVDYCSCQFCQRLRPLLPPHQPPIVAVVEAVMQIEPAIVSTWRPNSLLCSSQQPLCPLRPELESRIPFQYLRIIAENAFPRFNQQYLLARLGLLPPNSKSRPVRMNGGESNYRDFLRQHQQPLLPHGILVLGNVACVYPF